MKIVLYAEVQPEVEAGIVPLKAQAQMILEAETISWADITAAREHVRSLIGEALAELAEAQAKQ